MRSKCLVVWFYIENQSTQVTSNQVNTQVFEYTRLQNRKMIHEGDTKKQSTKQHNDTTKQETKN